jgi:hypothetical protein
MKYDHDLRNAGYSQEDLYIHQLEYEQSMEAQGEPTPVSEDNPRTPQSKPSRKSQKFEPPEGLGYAIGLMF